MWALGLREGSIKQGVRFIWIREFRVRFRICRVLGVGVLDWA